MTPGASRGSRRSYPTRGRAADGRRGRTTMESSEPTRGAAPRADLTSILAANLRRLRTHRHLTLERLASSCGVSRAMLSQLELGRSTPSVNTLWKIAKAFDVPFSALLSDVERKGVHVLRAESAKVLSNAAGTFSSRALFPFDAPRRVELYELRAAPGGEERAEPHLPGTIENLVVCAGMLEVEADGVRHTLGPGDAVAFAGDGPHAYRNPSSAVAVAYLVMSYAEELR